MFSLCPNHCRWNEIVVCEVWPCLLLIRIARQKCYAGSARNFRFSRQFPPLFPSWQPKSSTFYNVFVVRAVFKLLINKLLFRWRKKTYLKLRPLFGSQIFRVSKCSDIQGSNPLWLSVSFFDYWLIRMSGFFTFFASH